MTIDYYRPEQIGHHGCLATRACFSPVDKNEKVATPLHARCQSVRSLGADAVVGA